MSILFNVIKNMNTFTHLLQEFPTGCMFSRDLLSLNQMSVLSMRYLVHVCMCTLTVVRLNTNKHNMWLWSYSDVTAALLLILEECLWLAAASSTSLTSLSNKTQVISAATGLHKPHCTACQRNIDYSSNYSRLRAK